DNVVVVLHALTGDSHITGPRAGNRPRWWDGVAGRRAVDTNVGVRLPPMCWAAAAPPGQLTRP
ncbi:homoserine O-acetyltransferase domain protein, partial [Mycobacterium xenopi 3993]